MMNLEEIENNNRAEKSRRKIAGFPNKRWMEEIDWLIAEIKRLRKELDSANDAIILLKTRLKQLQKAVEIEHDQGESFLTQIKELRKDNDRLNFENRQFKDYVIKTGCSYTQTESDCECDYDYPWLCDHCPVLEHNKAIDTEMKEAGGMKN